MFESPVSFVEDYMKFKLIKTALSIDHITLTSDDRRFIKFKPKIITRLQLSVGGYQRNSTQRQST